MAWVTYIEHNGTEHRIELNTGVSLMQGAVSNMIPGIEGDCGGLCACATCHVYVDPQWLQNCSAPEELETNILDFAFDVESNSRLACQIKVDDTMDGMVVRMPERQY
jgi:2Fe-2S ferredoxin